MTNKEKIERIKFNQEKIDELIKQRNETMRKLFRIYLEKKARESQNEQTD